MSEALLPQEQENSLGKAGRGFTERNKTVDCLRGLACLSVCLYHFVHGNPLFMPGALVRSATTYGWAGAQVFFVISGYVIPRSLLVAEYRMGDAGSFLLKRLARLGIPYLASLPIFIGLWWLSARAPGFHGQPFHLGWPRLAANVFLASDLTGERWLNPVSWTLAIEMQFYAFLAIAFPLLKSGHAGIRRCALLAGSCLPLICPNTALLGPWMFCFLYGISTFQVRAGLLKWREYLLWAGTWTLASGLNEPVSAVVCLMTSLTILLVRIEWRLLLWLGTISYSLYLLHVPIGGRVVNLSLRWELSPGWKMVVICGALTVACLCADAFYRFVERPALEAGRRLAARTRRQKEAQDMQK